MFVNINADDFKLSFVLAMFSVVDDCGIRNKYILSLYLVCGTELLKFMRFPEFLKSIYNEPFSS